MTFMNLLAHANILLRYEFRLLQFLLASPCRVFNRDQLMYKIWEEPEMSLDRTVDTHIKTIRQKHKAIRPDEEVIITCLGIEVIKLIEWAGGFGFRKGKLWGA